MVFGAGVASLEVRRDFGRFAVLAVMAAVLSEVWQLVYTEAVAGARAVVQDYSKQPRVPRSIPSGAPVTILSPVSNPFDHPSAAVTPRVSIRKSRQSDAVDQPLFVIHLPGYRDNLTTLSQLLRLAVGGRT